MARTEGWKALTYRTLSELSTGTERPFYYSLGLPAISPPHLRGSCLIQFSSEFVESTVQDVAWWSIPDTGAISAGFIGAEIVDSRNEDWRNSATSLDYLLSAIHSQEEVRNKFTKREPMTASAADLLSSAGISVPSANLVDTRWWSYEVVLSAFGGGLRDHHVVALHLPHTLRRSVSGLLKVDSAKVKFFNPHFGLESIEL